MVVTRGGGVLYTPLTETSVGKACIRYLLILMHNNMMTRQLSASTITPPATIPNTVGRLISATGVVCSASVKTKSTVD